MSSSNMTQDHESQTTSVANEPTTLSDVKPTPLPTTPQLLLENAVANLWAAVKMAEATLEESARMLEETPTSENVAVVVVAQRQMAARLEELRYAMKVDFKHAGVEELLKRGLNATYQEAKK